jgi:hypothetical protein
MVGTPNCRCERPGGASQHPERTGYRPDLRGAPQPASRPKNDKSPAMRGLRVMRRSGLEPPPGYPGPGPQPDSSGAVSVRYVPDRPHRPAAGTIWTDWTFWMLSRTLPRRSVALSPFSSMHERGGSRWRPDRRLLVVVPSGRRMPVLGDARPNGREQEGAVGGCDDRRGRPDCVGCIERGGSTGVATRAAARFRRVAAAPDAGYRGGPGCGDERSEPVTASGHASAPFVRDRWSGKPAGRSAGGDSPRPCCRGGRLGRPRCESGCRPTRGR